MTILMRLHMRRPRQFQYICSLAFQKPVIVNGLPTCQVYCNKMTGNTSDNVKKNLKQPSQSFRTSPLFARQPKLNIEEEDQHATQRSTQTSNTREKNSKTNHEGEDGNCQKSEKQQQQPPTPPPSSTSKENLIEYDISWIFPKQRNPSKLWLLTSQFIIALVGIFSKFVLVFMNRTHVYNIERLVDNINKRPKGQPLLTVSNHHSCFDDPGLWGILPLHVLCNTLKIRWSMAAHDICFTNLYHSTFFMFGKCIPVVRGMGVYQDAVDLCIQKCSLGHWVHVFPEGKVNMSKEEMRLKWGVGRIIYESKRIPLIIPMWHIGMDEVLPNVEPYIIKWGKRVTVNIGEPLDLNDFIQDLKDRRVPEPEARKLITDKIQDAFKIIRRETEALHKEKVN